MTRPLPPDILDLIALLRRTDVPLHATARVAIAKALEQAYGRDGLADEMETLLGPDADFHDPTKPW